MKNIKSILAIVIVIGGLGISQAFACKSPAQGLLAHKGILAKDRSVDPDPDATGQSNSNRQYTSKDISGAYSSFATATLFDGSRTEYATCVGLITFDGKGNFVDKEVHSYDGALVTDQFTGTYEIHPDGTGAMHYVGAGETYEISFVISNSGSKITFL